MTSTGSLLMQGGEILGASGVTLDAGATVVRQWDDPHRYRQQHDHHGERRPADARRPAQRVGLAGDRFRRRARARRSHGRGGRFRRPCRHAEARSTGELHRRDLRAGAGRRDRSGRGSGHQRRGQRLDADGHGGGRPDAELSGVGRGARGQQLCACRTISRAEPIWCWGRRGRRSRARRSRRRSSGWPSRARAADDRRSRIRRRRSADGDDHGADTGRCRERRRARGR